MKIITTFIRLFPAVLIGLLMIMWIYLNSNTPTFTAETAEHYLEIIKLNGGFKMLKGLPTSHPWLTLGPLPYYLFYPVFRMASFNPLTLFYFWLTVSVLLIPVNYFIVKKTADRFTAILSTIFLATSPFYLWLSQNAGFYQFIIPLNYVAVWFLYLAVKKKFALWPVFLISGLMLNFHFASVISLIFFTGLFVYLKRLHLRSAVESLAAFVIPNIFFFTAEIKNNFSVTKNIFLWAPYKLMMFVTGKTIGLNRSAVPDITLESVSRFLTLNIFHGSPGAVLPVLILIFISVYLIFKTREIFIKILVLWCLLGVIILIVHKNPPLHYFVPLFPQTLIIFSGFLKLFRSNPLLKIFLIIFLAATVYSNLSYAAYQKRGANSGEISLADQEKISSLIVRDARGRSYRLRRIGPFDNYKNGFADNYIFLLWRRGNRPSEVNNVKLTYTIIENGKKITGNEYLTVGKINNVSILRSD